MSLILIAIGTHLNEGNQNISGASHATARRVPGSVSSRGATGDLLAMVVCSIAPHGSMANGHTIPANISSCGIGTLRSRRGCRVLG